MENTPKINTEEKKDLKLNNIPEIKSMTRKQIKELRAEGLDPALNGSFDKTPDLVDWIIDHVYPELNGADDMEYSVIVKLAADTYTRAYRGPEAIKN